MKHTLLIVMALILFVGCQKDLQSPSDSYVERVRKDLQDSLSKADFQALDFSRAARSSVDSVGLYFLRVPFKEMKQNEDFVMVQTTKTGIIQKGNIVHLQGKIDDYSTGSGTTKTWNGNISLASLDRKSLFQSPIQNGYVTAFHQQNRYRTGSHEPEGKAMPEVIITYTIPSSGGGFSWSTWFMLQLPGWGNSGGGGSYYSDFSGGGSSGGSGGYSGSGGAASPGDGVHADPVILVDRETQDEFQPIDIEKFINCFNAIPDAGATCSIEILADIPVDSDPNKIFNYQSKSPGHTFLNIRKSNGTRSVSQNIGFYPKNGWKTVLTNAPIDGKFVNNELHEFNCGFKLNITPAQLNLAIMEMLKTKNIKYDIDNFNCTDWALDVFNAAGGNLKIPLYDIPGNYPSVGTRMPNGVYNKLREMKNSNDPRAAGITIGIVKGFAGNSTGPCN